MRAYRNPELTYDYEKESDIRLIKTNPINRVFRQQISENKGDLCCDNRSTSQHIQYNTEAKHVLKTSQISLIRNKIESEWATFLKVVCEF